MTIRSEDKGNDRDANEREGNANSRIGSPARAGWQAVAKGVDAGEDPSVRLPKPAAFGTSQRVRAGERRPAKSKLSAFHMM
jgi:hypothetical protein